MIPWLNRKMRGTWHRFKYSTRHTIKEYKRLFSYSIVYCRFNDNLIVLKCSIFNIMSSRADMYFINIIISKIMLMTNLGQLPFIEGIISHSLLTN